MTTTPLRIAGAPISWGVCEVPDWGYQMPADRVLTEMQSIGITATEFGPDGFLPEEPAAKAEFLHAFGLQAVGGFLPVVLADANHDPLPEVDTFIDACIASGAGVVVLAASTGADGYDARPVLDELQWKTLLANLDRIADHAASRGVVAALHPHMGTLIQDGDDVQRVIDGSHVGLCIDTGHLAAAGADPVAITLANLERVKHVHLKDVDTTAAARVVAGDISFADAVAKGMWQVLGEGDVDIRSMIKALRAHGYDGWWVLEQDVMFKDGAPSGEGPVADVRSCLAFVQEALA